MSQFQSTEDLMLNGPGGLTITASRTTNTIVLGSGKPAPLPIVIFGANDYKAQYANFLKQGLQVLNNVALTKVTATISTDSNGNVLFTFTQGSNSDIIKVSYKGNLNNYAAYLSAMNNDYFRSAMIRYSINDATNFAAQIQNNIPQINSIASLSLNTQLELVLDAFINPQDQRNDRADAIFPETDFTANTAIVDTIQPVSSVNPYNVNYNVFMSKRANLNKIYDGDLK
jgi:hypothetical protein